MMEIEDIKEPKHNVFVRIGVWNKSYPNIKDRNTRSKLFQTNFSTIHRNLLVDRKRSTRSVVDLKRDRKYSINY